MFRDITSSEVHAPPPPSGSAGNWSIQQLTGFLAMVSSAEDERTASRVAVDRAAEALGAEVAALLRRGEVVASVGFRRDPMVEAALADIAEGRTARLMAPGLEDRPALAITVDAETPSRLVFAREGTREFASDEIYLARGMAHVLSLSGYTDDVISRHGMDGLRLVQKPFDAQTLLGAVRSALDA